MGEGDTLINALIGAAVSVVLSGLLPFSPLFGGGVAGYMQGGDRSEGLRTGAISGVIALVPAAVIGLLVFAFVATMFLGGAVTGSEGAGVFGALSFVAMGFFGFVFLVYFVGLSTLGGWLGNYVKYETDFEV
jgi:uncharacterized membrane protein (GlpM family)